MKNFLFLILMIVTVPSFGNKSSNPQNSEIIFQDSVATLLASMNLISYKDLPVDSFIAKIPQTYTSMKIYGWSRVEVAGILLIEYPNDVFLIIHVLEFTHMNPENPNKLPPDQVWSVSLFRKEKIHYIKVYNGIDCINGCENR